MDLPLLATKLYLPPPSPKLVERSRLIDRLQEGLDRRLTIVSAPPGFGKTTLVSAWLATIQQEAAVAWVSLDEEDNDPSRFWRYVAAALEGVAPGLGDDLLAMLSSVPPSPRALAASLLPRLGAHPGKLLLVLDDTHAIETPAIHEALGFLVENLPANAHLVLIGRSDPPLPLSRLRARGLLSELRGADLRFDARDAAAFLNDLMGLSLSEEAIAALETRTEGWIVGLQLAALSMQGLEDREGFVAAFTGNHRYVVDFLTEEVLRRQPSPIQSFLLETSVLDRLSAELCDALTGRDDGQETLEALERSNLFLIPLDDERHWYRYHHLFADALRHRLGTARSIPLHRQAAAWLERNGQLVEAVQHALKGQDHLRAARLIEACEALWRRGETRTLTHWLDALPEAVLDAHPGLCLLKAWALVPTGKLDQKVVLFGRAEAGLAALPLDERRRLAGPLTGLKAYLCRWQGDVAQAIALAREALAQLPEDDWMWRGIVGLTLAAAYHLDGQSERAMTTYAELADASRRREDAYYAIVAMSMRAQLLQEQGKLHRARALYEEALAYADARGGRRWPVTGLALAGLGEIAWEWGEDAMATSHLEESVLSGEDYPQAGLRALRLLAQTRTDHAEAQAALDRAWQTARRAGASTLITRWTQATQALVALRFGHRADALRWAEAIDASTLGPLTEVRRAELATLLRIRLAEGETALALPLLEVLAAYCEQTGRMGGLVEALALRALGHHRKGDDEAALSDLARALHLAAPEGYVRTFTAEGEAMASLLNRLAGTLPTGDPLVAYARSLAARASGKPPATPSRPPAEALSEREQEVLRLIAAGTTNQGIADRLGIELSTAKKHSSNILGKLGSANRTQAVAHARELGLL